MPSPFDKVKDSSSIRPVDRLGPWPGLYCIVVDPSLLQPLTSPLYILRQIPFPAELICDAELRPTPSVLVVSTSLHSPPAPAGLPPLASTYVS